jgi:fido (protein-threonine AMPylation protein)
MSEMTPLKRDFLLSGGPEIFRSSDHAAVSRATARGELRRIARGLYTSNLDEPVEQLVRRRWLEVASIYFPGSVIVDRSAVDGRPAADGSLFLDTGPLRPSPRDLPGLALRPRSGPGPLPSDMPFGSLHRSSQARTAIDNVRASRARRGIARTLSQEELEEWLERIARSAGEEELLRIRDEARRLAPELDAVEEQERLDAMISSLLGTGETRLTTEVARARGAGSPFDPDRLVLFEKLRGTLAGHIATRFPEKPDPNRVFAFFEAYFSNFIEGTEFDLEEAREIIFEGAMPEERPADAHDILGTFEVLTDPSIRSRVPADAGELIDIIRDLNQRILSGRPEVNPGEFKTVANRAGGTLFVAPDMVEGTLREAWAFYETLTPGYARAMFALFAVAEIHPFADGNGRVARALANAELSAAGEIRLLIPLAFRPDYLGALRTLSRQSNPNPLVRVGERLQRWASLVDFRTFDTALARMEDTNALVPSDQAEAEGLILRDPS